MKAQVGDRIIVESNQLNVGKRVGVITGIQHDDGSPPYWVNWLDNDHEALYVPGPDCHLESAGRAR
ncbi:MAG: DUF1918 domain-containing protein [Corynebacteriales bacterium]|nr:DUF1918 domain-containing protein [Mycobacteriales bacterium]